MGSWLIIIGRTVPLVLPATRQFEVTHAGVPGYLLAGRRTVTALGWRPARPRALQVPGMRWGTPEAYGQDVAVRSIIVDDNPGFLEAARGLLERGDVQVVATTPTGDEAVDAARRLRPDVVLVDVFLGDESGFEVARRLTEEPGLDHLAVILISTYAESDLADLIAASPAIGFVSKSKLSEAAILDILDRRNGA
jgi:CheY-like chemotaxis protein